MTRIDPARYEEIRKVQRMGQKREEQTVVSQDSGSKEQSVLKENTRAVSLALGDKTFQTNVEKVKRLKQKIDSGNYNPEPKQIANRLVQSEARGDVNMGLTSG